MRPMAPSQAAIPETDLKSSAWYNDFMLRGGIDDVLGVKVFEDESVSVVVGFHRDLTNVNATFGRGARIRALWDPLARAARLHVGFRHLNRKLSAANQALDHLLAGVILAESDGRVIDMNDPADTHPPVE